MKFLVISKPKHMFPPEFAVPLIDAFSAFIDKYEATGQLESSWSFAGTQGGGGIANVDSLEELDSIMVEYPFGPFSDVEVYPLVDLKESLQRSKQVSQMMAQQMGG
jgi:muconolactone delta-isomerase